MRVATVLLFLLSRFSASAITTAGNPGSYVVPTGTGLDGIAALNISRLDTDLSCSGALLAGGLFVLTAAHCLSGFDGHVNVISSLVSFDLPGGQVTLSGASYLLDPGWSGSLLLGHDVGLIRLAAPAPATADRYDIYRGRDELGQAPTLVGYGFSGTGTTGVNAGIFPFGVKREGLNRYDEDGALFGAFPADAFLSYDFDDGTPIHDAFGYLGLTPDLGLGPNEVFAAPGDSGGPSFLHGRIAGIHSFTGWPGSPPDIDGLLFNSSFGELGADTRVSSYAGFIDRATAVPEPGSFFCISGGILLLFALAIRKHAAGCRWVHGSRYDTIGTLSPTGSSVPGQKLVAD